MYNEPFFLLFLLLLCLLLLFFFQFWLPLKTRPLTDLNLASYSLGLLHLGVGVLFLDLVLYPLSCSFLFGPGMSEGGERYLTANRNLALYHESERNCYMHFTSVLGTSAWAGEYVTRVFSTPTYTSANTLPAGYAHMCICIYVCICMHMHIDAYVRL